MRKNNNSNVLLIKVVYHLASDYYNGKLIFDKGAKTVKWNVITLSNC